MTEPYPSFCPGVERAYAKGRFGQIHYRRTGPEAIMRPLMLLHLSPMSGYIYENFMVEMGRDRTVIAPDTPGFGMSNPPPFAPDIADYAAAMFDLADASGLGEFDIMGYHTGSVTVVEMARQQPDRVRHVIMVSAPIAWPEEVAAKLADHGRRSPAERMAAMPDAWLYRCEKLWHMQPELVRWNLFLEFHRNADISFWGHRAVYNYPLAEVLRTIENPILVLNPEDDLWTITPRAAPLLKNGRVCDLPGWSFGFLTVEAPASAAIVRAFLDDAKP